MIPTLEQLRFILKCIGAAIVLVIVILGATMAFIFTRFGGTASLKDAALGDDRTHCALVFGAAVHAGDQAGPGIERRTETAVFLYQEGLMDKLYFTGARDENDQATEASVMRGVAMRMGVDPVDIVLEENSRSTWENLLFSKPLMEDCDSTTAISDRYHLARIELLASQQGWENLETYPAKITAPWYFELRGVGREALAYLYYLLDAYRK